MTSTFHHHETFSEYECLHRCGVKNTTWCTLTGAECLCKISAGDKDSIINLIQQRKNNMWSNVIYQMFGLKSSDNWTSFHYFLLTELPEMQSDIKLSCRLCWKSVKRWGRLCIFGRQTSSASPCSVSGWMSDPGVMGAWLECFKRLGFVQRQQSKGLTCVWVLGQPSGRVWTVSVTEYCIAIWNVLCHPHIQIVLSSSTVMKGHSNRTGERFIDAQFLVNLHMLHFKQDALSWVAT